MADQPETTAAVDAPPDKPTGDGSEGGELEEHGVALGSSFPEMWAVSSPETENSDNDVDNDEVSLPATTKGEMATENATPNAKPDKNNGVDIVNGPPTDEAKSETVAEDAPITTSDAKLDKDDGELETEDVTEDAPLATTCDAKLDKNNDETAKDDTTSNPNDDDNFEVSVLRKTWKQKAQTTKRSQLLNLNDFHMQQRQHRVGDKLKKGEAAQNLHSFRNNDAPTRQQNDVIPVKQPPPEQTKAADRAAMAQYMFLRQSKSKEGKPAATTAPHRTLSLKNPTPDLTPSKSGEDSTSSSVSNKSATSKWRKSPTSGKSVIVTDVDEFYAQQHAIHLENERKKREILHISDNKDVLPDRSSTMPPPDYKKTVIPALADSASDVESLSMAASNLSMDDSEAKPHVEDETVPRNLAEEYDEMPSELEAADEKQDEAEREDDGGHSDAVDQVSAVSDAVDEVANESIEIQLDEKDASVNGKPVELEIENTARETRNESTSALRNEHGEEVASPESDVDCETFDQSDDTKDESAVEIQGEKGEEEKLAEDEAVEGTEDSRNEPAVDVHNEPSDETNSLQATIDDADVAAETIAVKVHTEAESDTSSEQKSVSKDAEQTNSPVDVHDDVKSSIDALDDAGLNEVESPIGSLAEGQNEQDEGTTLPTKESAVGGDIIDAPEQGSEAILEQSALHSGSEDERDEGNGVNAVEPQKENDVETKSQLQGSVELDVVGGTAETAALIATDMQDKTVEAATDASTPSKPAEESIEEIPGDEAPIAVENKGGDSLDDSIVEPSEDDRIATGEPDKEHPVMDEKGGDSEDQEPFATPHQQREQDDAEDTARSSEVSVSGSVNLDGGDVTVDEEDFVLVEAEDVVGEGTEVVTEDSKMLPDSVTESDEGIHLSTVGGEDTATDEVVAKEEETLVGTEGGEAASPKDVTANQAEAVSNDEESGGGERDISSSAVEADLARDAEDRDSPVDRKATSSADAGTAVASSTDEKVSSVEEGGGNALSPPDNSQDVAVVAISSDSAPFVEVVSDKVVTEAQADIGNDISDELGDELEEILDQPDEDNRVSSGQSEIPGETIESSAVRNEESNLPTGSAASSEKPTSELLDHVPDDISVVSTTNDDSTASVNGDMTDEGNRISAEQSSEVLIAETIESDTVRNEESNLSAASSETPSSELLDHVPDDISVVSTNNDDSTASVDGDVTDSVVLTDLRDEESDILKDAEEPWDEGDELISSNMSRSIDDEEQALPRSGAGMSSVVDAETGEPTNADECGENADVPASSSSVDDTEPVLESVLKEDSVDETVSEELLPGFEVSAEKNEDDVTESDTEELVLDELLASRDESGSRSPVEDDSPAVEDDMDEPVHTDTERVTMEQRNASSVIAGEDAEAALDDVLQDDNVVEHDEEVSKEVSVDVDADEELGPDDESALDELLASREEPDIRSPVEDDMNMPVHTDTAPGTMEQRHTGSAVAGEDAEAVEESVLREGTVVEPVLDEHAEEVHASKEVSVDVDVEEELGPDDESALDELLASREEPDIRSPVEDDMNMPVHTDTAPGTMEQRHTGSAVAGEDAEAVEESVLREDTVVEPVLDEHAEVSKELIVDVEEELGPDDESALDELLASRDDSEGQSPLGSGNNEGLSKQASMDVEEVLEDIIAGAVVEELLASVDDASSHATAENHDTSAQSRSQEVAAVGETDSNIPTSRRSEGENASGLMENLLVDESALKLFEETDGDTSGFNSDSNKADESLLEQDDHSELHNISAIYPASSKDTTDDVLPSEVISQFMKSGSNDETGYIVSKGSKVNSLASSDTSTDSSNETPGHHGCAPSAGSTDKPAATSPGAKVEVDYKSVDYRGFVFVVHKTYGLMLLHCTRKKKKGPHFQLPGGHIDEPEFFAAAEESRDGQTQLLLASRAGAARELYEETGMDVRYQLDRMEPAALRDEGEVDKHGKPLLQNELKHRLYFFLPVTDDDFWSSDKGDSDAGMMHPMGAALGCDGSQLMLKLSHEHQGWTFEKDPNKSTQMLAVHSGGQGATALRMSMARNAPRSDDSKQTSDKKPAAKPDETQATKELQSETWETEPLVKDDSLPPTDEAPGADSQVATRAAPDLLPPPASGLSKLFSCCLWWQSTAD